MVVVSRVVVLGCVVIFKSPPYGAVLDWKTSGGVVDWWGQAVTDQCAWWWLGGDVSHQITD